MRTKTRVTCSIDDDVLAALDAEAEAAGLSRSAALERALEGGLGLPGRDGARCGVFVGMSEDTLARMEAWAERTGAGDLGRMLYSGFLNGIDAAAWMSTATEPVRACDVAALMAGPAAPTENLVALWMDPATDGTMHPRFAYEQEPGTLYRASDLLRALGVSGEAYSTDVADPAGWGYEEVYRERR